MRWHETELLCERYLIQNVICIALLAIALLANGLHLFHAAADRWDSYWLYATLSVKQSQTHHDVQHVMRPSVGKLSLCPLLWLWAYVTNRCKLNWRAYWCWQLPLLVMKGAHYDWTFYTQCIHNIYFASVATCLLAAVCREVFF